MKLAITLSILLVAMPAGARDIILKLPPEPTEEEAPTKPSTLNLRATQVIRCVDARGNLILQDVPCTPVAAKGPSAAPEVIELSSLAPRPAADLPPTVPQEPGMSGFTKGLLNGAWKLALLVLACYAAVRVIRAGRDRYRDRYPPAEARRRGPRRVN